MAFLPLRDVPLPDPAGDRYGDWLTYVDKALDDSSLDRNDFCRRILEGLFHPGGLPGIRAGGDAGGELTRAVALDQLDPRNVTLEPEYYRDMDPERYYPVKPLLWLWEMFDRSPAGENVALGVPFRRILARRIFKRCGRNFKAFHQVKLSFGYNLEVGDDVVVHRHVLLDDRGGIVLGDGCSISDYANIYSHTHDILDGREVYNRQTVIGEGVRITYHATILAGSRVERDAMVGAGAILTRDAEAGGVYVGVPARKVKNKDVRDVHARPPATPDPLADDRITTRDEAGEG